MTSLQANLRRSTAEWKNSEAVKAIFNKHVVIPVRFVPKILQIRSGSICAGMSGSFLAELFPKVAQFAPESVAQYSSWKIRGSISAGMAGEYCA